MSTPAEHLIDTMQPEESEGGGFEIVDEAGADWALRKIAHKKREMNRNTALAEDEHRRIQKWHEEVNGPLEIDIELLEGFLVEYHRARLAENPNDKTIKLPGGTLKSRAPGAPSVDVDLDTFIPWAKAEHPELVRVKEEADKVALKKLLVPDAPDDKAVDKETGEVIPGVVIERGDVRFTVDVEVDG